MNESEQLPPAPRRGRGRPPLGEGDKLSVRYVLKLLPDDRAKLANLGGAAWLRRQIRRAKVR